MDRLKALLIVDDEPRLRTFARDLLEAAGYRVKEAATSDEAISLLEDDGIEAVLTNIEMSGTLNGLDLAWMIRTRWPTMPVVVTSGEVLPLPTGLPANTSVLTKPYSRNSLLNAIKRTG